jgi:hypothetical protein
MSAMEKLLRESRKESGVSVEQPAQSSDGAVVAPEHTGSLIKLAVLVAATVFLLGPTLPAFGHSHDGDEIQEGCWAAGDHTHGSSSVITATTIEGSYLSICSGVQAKARWKVDTTSYVDVDTDTTGSVYVATAGTSGGFDIFYSSDHNGRDENYDWFGFRLWH